MLIEIDDKCILEIFFPLIFRNKCLYIGKNKLEFINNITVKYYDIFSYLGIGVYIKL